jgi:hypothetical protein
METADFFRARIDAMINLSDPLAVLARRLPWDQIEASLAAKFEREERAGQVLEGHDMFGPTESGPKWGLRSLQHQICVPLGIVRWLRRTQRKGSRPWPQFPIDFVNPHLRQ